MKNYFKFSLTADKILPIWIMFLLSFMIPYAILIYNIKYLHYGNSPVLLMIVLYTLLIVSMIVFLFYFTKQVIENMTFKDNRLKFEGSFGEYLGIVVLGIVLSIVSLGIYSPWFIRDVNRFFASRTSYQERPFNFLGKGGKLFVIITLTYIVPIVILISILTTVYYGAPEKIASYSYIQQAIMLVLIIPYMYFVYKWTVNFDYNGLQISWRTDFWNSVLKMALEIFLSIITIGIYYPMAMIKLYKYFTDKTVARSAERSLIFGYDIEATDDFLFIWGQTLLTIVTLGVYYPWALCKIGNRIIGKTYLFESEPISVKPTALEEEINH
jgi:uncharacterized membrane protein YjgN (DUF898 family)